MAKQITIVAKDGESVKDKATASLINIVAGLLVVGLVATVGYFLIPVLWNIIKFVVLLWNFLVALFFTIGLFLSNKHMSDQDVTNGLTHREKIHENRKAKPVSECSDEEKNEVLEKDKGRNGLFILVASSLWLAPLFFGLTKQLQFFPANILAPLATLLGFIAWIILSGNTVKKYDILDEKIKPGTNKYQFLYKLTATINSIYFLLITISIVANAFGITLPHFTFLAR